MKRLVEYILKHSRRGECRCVNCFDKPAGTPVDEPEHSADVHFFWVSACEGATKEGLLEVLKEYPEQERLQGGPSYIEMGAILGDQSLALRLIGLGAVLGVWTAVTPASLQVEGDLADKMAGNGFVMAGGLRSGERNKERRERLQSELDSIRAEGARRDDPEEQLKDKRSL